MPLLKDPKKELFCREFVNLGNGTQAAINAGYSERSAANQASRLLKNDEISARIEELQGALAERWDINEDQWMAHLAAIGMQNMDSFLHYTSDGEPYVDVTKATPLQRAAIHSIQVEDYLDGRGEDARDVRKVKVKLHPKLPALLKLGEKLGYLRSDQDAADDRTQSLIDGLREVATTPLAPGAEIGLIGGNTPFKSPAEYHEHMAAEFRKQEAGKADGNEAP